MAVTDIRTHRNNRRPVIWQPRPPTLENYEFVDRVEHELAFEWAAQFGPRPGMAAVDVLPPLPHEPDFLFSYAAASAAEQWCDIPLGIPDPRTPWRADSIVGRVRALGRGYLLIQPYASLGAAGAGEGWKASYLSATLGESGARTMEHALCDAETGHPVRFSTRDAAEQALRPLVMAGGKAAYGWEWRPALEDALDWVGLPPDPRRPGPAEITRTGAGCQWLIQCDGGTHTLWRQPTGGREPECVGLFPILDDAKRHCEEEDRRCRTAPY